MKELKTKEFFETISQTKLSIMEFFTPRCPGCKILSDAIAEIESEYADINFGKVNVSQEFQVAEKFQIQSVPMLIVFRAGKPIATEYGSKSVRQLKKIIREIV